MGLKNKVYVLFLASMLLCGCVNTANKDIAYSSIPTNIPMVSEKPTEPTTKTLSQDMLPKEVHDFLTENLSEGMTLEEIDRVTNSVHVLVALADDGEIPVQGEMFRYDILTANDYNFIDEYDTVDIDGLKDKKVKLIMFVLMDERKTLRDYAVVYYDNNDLVESRFYEAAEPLAENDTSNTKFEKVNTPLTYFNDIYFNYANDEVLKNYDKVHEFNTGGEKVVFITREQFKNFCFIDIGFHYRESEFDYFQKEVLFSVREWTPAEPIVITTSISEGIPARGISFTDEKGNQKYYYIGWSGEDDSIGLVEFQNKPNGTDDENKDETIYFERSNGIYKYNEDTDDVELYFEWPQGAMINPLINEKTQEIYYVLDEGSYLQPIYSLRKVDVETKKETVIAPDVGMMGARLYNDSIYFYDFVSHGIVKYDTAADKLEKYNSYVNRGNGNIEIYNGRIYFFSSGLFQLSIDDLGVKEIANREKFPFNGEFYADHIFYTDILTDGRGGLLKMDLNTFQKTVIDSFEVNDLDSDFDLDINGVDFSDDLLVRDDLVYYSYNNCTYSMNINGGDKEKAADFPIRGDMYLRNNKLLWYYQIGQDTGIGGPLSPDGYELFSYDLLTKQTKNYQFK